MRVTVNEVIGIGVFALLAIMVIAIAQQEFSWWVLPFSLLFLATFGGIIWVCFLNYREDRFRRASEGDYPNEPWMWDERWRSNRMTSRSRSDFWGSLTFTIILGVFAFIGIVTLLHGLPEGNFWVLLNIIPIACAIHFARNSYFAWRTWRLERHISFATETRPAWVGATFSAVMTAVNGQRADQVEAWLEHFKIIRREEDDGVTFQKVVDRRLSGYTEDISDGQIRISVDIPEKSAATSWSEDVQERWWDFVVVTVLSGEKITLRYNIPVADPAMHRRSKA